MGYGALTSHIDVAQVVLYVFFGFFFCLVGYLQRESNREGFPLIEESPGRRTRGLFGMPKPKTFLMADGHVIMAPRMEAPEIPVNAVHAAPWAGAPLVPTGDAMLDGLGAGAYANRSDTTDKTFEGGLDRVVPLRVATDHFLATEDPSPIGYAVEGADHLPAGVVVDVWIDRSETVCRYMEIELTAALGARRVLVPMNDAQIVSRRRRIDVPAIMTAQFAGVPGLRHPDQVTLLEEDMIQAYYAGGELYASPSRMEPLI